MFHSIPDQAFDELDVYEYRLFSQYLRLLSQPEDTIALTVRQLSQSCGISPQLIIRARKSLSQKQYILTQQDYGVRNQRYRTSINWTHFDSTVSKSIAEAVSQVVDKPAQIQHNRT